MVKFFEEFEPFQKTVSYFGMLNSLSQTLLKITYMPLTAEGELKDQVCGFARQKDNKAVLVVVPRFMTQVSHFTVKAPFGEKGGERPEFCSRMKSQATPLKMF